MTENKELDLDGQQAYLRPGNPAWQLLTEDAFEATKVEGGPLFLLRWVVQLRHWWGTSLKIGVQRTSCRVQELDMVGAFGDMSLNTGWIK